MPAASEQILAVGVLTDLVGETSDSLRFPTTNGPINYQVAGMLIAYNEDMAKAVLGEATVDRTWDVKHRDLERRQAAVR